MFSLEKIPMAKVREAFNLNELESERLLSELWPDVYPWDLWEDAYIHFWKSTLINKEEKLKIPFVALPDMNGIWEFSPVSWCRSKTTCFISALIYSLPADNLIEGTEYVFTETFDIPDMIFKKERERLYNRLKEIENGFDWRTHLQLRYEERARQREQLEQILNDKAYHLGKGCRDFFEEIAYDTMLVNKYKACETLIKYSYPYRKEVKGITIDYIEYVVRKFNNRYTDTNNDKVLSKPNTSLNISSSLWNGKSPQFIVEQMRATGYGDDIIAHILFFKRGIKKKREIGKLLGFPNLSDSAYDKIGKELLVQADTLTIVDAD